MYVGMGPVEYLVDYSIYLMVEGIFGFNPSCGPEELVEDSGCEWNELLVFNHPPPLVGEKFSPSGFILSSPVAVVLPEEPFYQPSGVSPLQEGLLGGLLATGGTGLQADLRRGGSFIEGGVVSREVEESREGFVGRDLGARE